LITACDDKTARVWDVPPALPVAQDGEDIPEGKEVAVLRGHEDRVTAAVLSPDGTLAATASADKTARLWRIFPNTQSLVDYARARLPRHLTREQRRREFYLPPDEDLNWAEKYAEEGEKLAREGKLEEALGKLTMKNEELREDARARAETWFILGRFAAGEKLAQEGKLDAAAEAFAQIKALSPNFDFDPKAKAEGIYRASEK
jgi:tetratricopeptide (TPR) repeat protein